MPEKYFLNDYKHNKEVMFSVVIISIYEYSTSNPVRFYSVLSVRSPFTSAWGLLCKFDQMTLHDVAWREHNAMSSPRAQFYYICNKQKELTGFCYRVQGTEDGTRV